MKSKTVFSSPRILREAALELGEEILLGSPFEKTVTVEATGQEVEDKSFDSSSTFNHTWE